jgi:membrane-bound lytic murein transglycosylase B
VLYFSGCSAGDCGFTTAFLNVVADGFAVVALVTEHLFRIAVDLLHQGRKYSLFASIQQRFGVPPWPILAIWGMETGFGNSRGNQNVLSAVATLAYDCRRSAYFTDQLYAALTLMERGILSAGTRGSMHGEVRSHPVPTQKHPELWHRRQSRYCN